MTLDIKKWKTILNVTDNTDILEHIKAKLKEQDESVYQEWEQSNFNLSYLFSVLTLPRKSREEVKTFLS